ncbi:16932_t:CDS:2, partial [Racocetra fulgida]
ATFFAQFVSFDITASKNTLNTYPMFLPADDPFYVLNGSSPNSPQIDVNFLPANRSAGNDGTNPLTSGINLVTPFLDLNNIYSSNDTLMLNKYRDTSSKRGKLKVSIASNGDQYPPKTPSGDYDLGATSTRSRNIFTLAIHTIWLREHNRMCDQLYQIYQDSWTDDQYFQEARRWTTAFYQKAVAEEYIGAIIGRPLPAYENYNPNLKPDDHGDVLINVALNDIKDLTLLENFGLEKEDVDNFFSNSTKKAIGPDQVTYDLSAFDLIRSRDRGNYIAVYGGYHPPTLDPNQDPELKSSLSYSFVNDVAIITFKRALSPKADEDEKRTMLLAHISHDDYNKLPQYTWEEFNERVQYGV